MTVEKTNVTKISLYCQYANAILILHETYKKNSDQLLNLFSEDRRESMAVPIVINHFSQTVPRFTTDDFLPPSN